MASLKSFTCDAVVGKQSADPKQNKTERTAVEILSVTLDCDGTICPRFTRRPADAKDATPATKAIRVKAPKDAGKDVVKAAEAVVKDFLKG